MRRAFPLAGPLALALAATGLAACHHAQAAPAAAGAAPTSLTVRRGTLQARLLLTGELKATRAVSLVTPSTPSFEVQVTWLAEDGAVVAAGDPVAQFDNSNFSTEIEQKRSEVATATADLARLTADGRAQVADKSYAVEQKQRDLEKARIEAAVPAELLPPHDYQDLQLKYQTATAELAKAQQDVAAARRGATADVAVQTVTLDKARRELAAAELGLRGMTVRAPQGGTLLIADHPYEGHKIQVGDRLIPGVTVATLPDLSSLAVEAALSDVDDGQVVPGLSATCYLDAFPDAPHAGRVVAVAGVARESGRTALLRYLPVRVELAPWSAAQLARLRPGMSVRVELDTARSASVPTSALLAPRAGLDLAASPPQARLAGGGQTVVRLGDCDAFWCVALAGVEAGQVLRRDRTGE
jgi:HlyD family secretion protein